MSDGCGCGCGTLTGVTGLLPANRPGLDELVYRRGTFATFRRALLDELARTPELAALHSRLSSDFSVTLLELWSAIADVVAFYNERAVNEAFLRTANTRDSVLRLVRLIDYHLAPGLAASAWLAFTLERDKDALVTVGTRVKSVPPPGASAQTYETLEPLGAHAVLNALRLRPQPGPDSPLAQGRRSAVAAPDPEAVAAAAALHPGDQVVLYAGNDVEVRTVAATAVDEELLTVTWDAPIVGAGFASAASATSADVGARRAGRSLPAFGRTAPPQTVVPRRKVDVDPTSVFLSAATTIYALTVAAGDTSLLLDGASTGLAPGATVLVVSEQAGVTTTAPFRVTDVTTVTASLPSTLPPASAGGTTVAGPAVATGPATRLALSPLGARTLTAFNGHDRRGIGVLELLGPALRWWPHAYGDRVTGPTAYVTGRRSGWSTIAVGRTVEKGVTTPGSDLDRALLEPGRRVLAVDTADVPSSARVDSVDLVGAQVRFGAPASDPFTLAELGLDPAHALPVTVLVSAGLAAGVTLNTSRRLTLGIDGRPPATVTLPAALVTSPTRAALAAALQAAIRAARPESPAYARAVAWQLGDAVAVSAGIPGKELTFGPAPDDGATVEAIGLAPDRVRYADGVLSAPVDGLVGSPVTGQITVRRGLDPAPTTVTVSITPATVAALAAHLATVTGVSVQPTSDARLLMVPAPPDRPEWCWLAVSLADGAAFDHDAADAHLLGNVAAASHGESIRDELLGDADAAVPFQQFTLRKKPVTLRAGQGGNAESSLTVRVDGIAWTEVPTLYGRGPREEVYVTRLDDDGTTTVRFGDGAMGARPLTGHANVAATYRQGSGVQGRVPAHSLTILLDRPAGVKKVDNPLPADGGADPESPDRTRTTAPGSVRTFGRAVSLRDFEDGALTQGEVAKARAAWVWNGHRRVVHLTVAGTDGATFGRDALTRIAGVLDSERDTNRPLLLAAHNPVAVRVEARVTVDPRYVADDVLAAVRTAVVAEMSFEHRSFAGIVHLSDLYAVMQDVPGVVGVDIDVLDLKRTEPAFRLAHGVDDSRPQPAPRILVLPAFWDRSLHAVVPAELACLEDPALDLVLTATGGGSA